MIILQDAKFACGTIAWAAIQNPSAVKEQLGVDGSLPQAGGTVKKGIIPGYIIFSLKRLRKNSLIFEVGHDICCCKNEFLMLILCKAKKRLIMLRSDRNMGNEPFPPFFCLIRIFYRVFL